MDDLRSAPAPPRDRPRATGTLAALLLANVRFWSTVAALTRSELRSWRQLARQIDDPELRALALAKLKDEGFNAEVAATLATIAPRPARAEATRAIVSLELLFDYLDGRTERALNDRFEQAMRLFGAFTGALRPVIEPQPSPAPGAASLDELPDGRYLAALNQRTRESLLALASAQVVAPVAHAAAQRCAQAQTRLHASATRGDRQLEDWAREHARDSALQWREYIAGCASSVLAAHALIAAAADPSTTAQDAQRIDRAYLAIGAVVTILDSLVDRRADTLHGEPLFTRLFADEPELRERLRALIREALSRAREAPHGEHHAMTLAGIAAFYTTHPGARDPRAREIVSMVRRELAPTIWPALGVLWAWRAAKAVRALTRRSAGGERWRRARGPRQLRRPGGTAG